MKSPPDQRRRSRLASGAGSLRFRIGLMLACLTILFLLLMSWEMGRYFGTLQDDLVSSRLEQVVVILNQDAKSKVRIARDNAEWDEAWNYLAGQNPDFLTRNYRANVNSSGQDLVMMFDTQLHLAGAIQTTHEVGALVPPKGLDLGAVAASRLLVDKAVAGLTASTDGPIMLTARPVKHSNLMGPSNGWLILGSYLDQKKLGEVEELSGVKAMSHAEEDHRQLSADVVTNLETDTLGRVQVSFPRAVSMHGHAAYVPADVSFESITNGKPITIDIKVPFAVYHDAVEARDWILRLLTIAALTVLLLGMLVLEWVVIKPLAALDEKMRKMSEAPHELGFLTTGRHDEIGRLAASANSLLDSVVAGRHEAEEGRALLKGVLDSAREGVIAFRAVRDAQGAVIDLDVVLLNHSAGGLLNVQPGEILGKSIRLIYPKLIESGVYDRWLRALLDKQPVSFEMFYDGHRINGWYHNSVVPWEDGFVVTFNDISDRKRKEKEIGDSYAEMDRLNSAMIGREERIIAMKREVNELRAKLGYPPLYKIDADEE